MRGQPTFPARGLSFNNTYTAQTGSGSIRYFAVGAFRAYRGPSALGETATGRGLGIRMMARPTPLERLHRGTSTFSDSAQNWATDQGLERGHEGAPFHPRCDATIRLRNLVQFWDTVHIIGQSLRLQLLYSSNWNATDGYQIFALGLVLTGRDVAKEVTYQGGLQLLADGLNEALEPVYD